MDSPKMHRRHPFTKVEQSYCAVDSGLRRIILRNLEDRVAMGSEAGIDQVGNLGIGRIV